MEKRLPAWFKVPFPGGPNYLQVSKLLKDNSLHTVCQEAHCPNIGECFEARTATFLILGDVCTRNCRFCAVDPGLPSPIDFAEADRVAGAVATLGLRYVVVTSVTRDDLSDGGAGQFRAAIQQTRRLCPGVSIEVLVPDFKGVVQALDQVIEARPEVLNHNLETVAGLYQVVRPGAQYRRSLQVLEYAARRGLTVKSGLMLGLGESEEEIGGALLDLKRAGCRYLTLGQYLAPSPGHVPVARFVSPREFEDWANAARSLGFTGVAAGPLVRSSYRAEEMFMTAQAGNADNKEQGDGQKAVRGRIGNGH